MKALRWRTCAFALLVLLLVAVVVPSGLFGAPPATGVIKGTVSGYDGSKLAGTRVVAYQMVGEPGQPGWNQEAVAEVQTAKNGAYTLSLQPGTYRLGFFPKNAARYAFEYYIDAPAAHLAADIVVSEGSRASKVNVQLAAASSISGRALDEAGNALPGMHVMLLQWWPAQLHDVLHATTGPEGEYSFEGLPADGYAVWGEDPGGIYVGSYDQWVELGSGEHVTDINLTMPRGGHITGRVTDGQGDPIAGMGVAVGAEPYFWDHIAWTETDANGDYDVLLPEGSYRVNFLDWNSLGYFNEWYDDVTDGDYAESVPVVVGQTTAGIDAVMGPAAYIRGRVTDPDGAPLPGISVEAHAPSDTDYPPYLNSVETNDNGDYELAVPPDEQALVQFSDYNYNLYVGEWYDDAIDYPEATPVTPTLATPAEGIDAELARGAHIRGTITDADGVPLEGIGVQACLPPVIEEDGPRNISGTETNENGDYDLLVTEGTFLVRFEDWNNNSYLGEWYDDAGEDWNEATPVATSIASPAEGIDAMLVRGAIISGRVTDSEQVGLAGIGVNANQATGDPNDPMRGVTGTETDGDGNYRLVVPAGDYLIRFEDWNTNTYLQEWYDDVQNWEDATSVPTSVDVPAEGIDAELARGAHITGCVTDGDGLGISGIQVSVNFETGDPNEPLGGVGGAQSDDNGDYDALVPPGTYMVQFGDWEQNRFLSEWFDDVVDWRDAADVTTSVEIAAEGIDAQLAAASFIEGRVVDSDGVGVEGVNVGAAQTGEQPWMMEFRGGTQTDENGDYRLAVAAGTWFVNYSPSDLTQFAQEWYNDQFVGQLATPVVVGENATQAGIDAVMDTPGMITGRVTDSSGNGIDGIRVVNAVDGTLPGQWWWFNQATTHDGGYYTLYCHPGLVKIGFFDNGGYWAQSWYPNAGWPGGGIAQLVVGGATLGGIDAVLVPTAMP